MQRINVVIVEPNQLFREGLRQLLREPPFAVVAVARIAAEAFATMESPPELVIWGPGAVGDAEVEMAWVRRRCKRNTHFVLLSDLSDVHWLRRILSSGVGGILSHDISSEVLQRSLTLVALGQQLFPAQLVYPPAVAGPELHANLIQFPGAGCGRTSNR